MMGWEEQKNNEVKETNSNMQYEGDVNAEGTKCTDLPKCLPTGSAGKASKWGLPSGGHTSFEVAMG